jgi:hypothetical protein
MFYKLLFLIVGAYFIVSTPYWLVGAVCIFVSLIWSDSEGDQEEVEEDREEYVRVKTSRKTKNMRKLTKRSRY